MAIESPTAALRLAEGAAVSGDALQKLRLRRFYMGAATSALMPVVLLVSSAIGVVPLRVAGLAAIVIASFIALFYVLFRSGLNQGWRDPSLTGEQILAAIVCIAFISYFAGAARPAIAMFYLVALLFGALRLGGARLLGLALIALLAHSTALRAWYQHNPGVDPTGALIELVALAFMLPWFAVMAAYVNSLRSRLSDSNRRLKIAFDRIEEIAIRDELTGVFNRRFLIEAMSRERARARRLGGNFAVCLFDIDHFKDINDSHGHAAGDAVLKHFAFLAGIGLRTVDVFGRYGGEEFLLVLPDTGLSGARVAAERVRSGIEGAGFPQVPGEQRVTATVGVACLREDETIEDLLGRADRALYDGKAAGRNRVVAVA
jgi:diguanylate cyclase (GGDEF)-like protein